MIAMRLLFLFLALEPLSSYAALNSETYVIHMDKTKIKALDASLGPNKKWYESIIESIAISSQEDSEDQNQPTSLPEILYVYETVISGFSAKLTNQHLESLKEIDGFLSAISDELLPLHTTHSPQFLGLQKGVGLWKSQNLASDVIIGVVDTGIWPEHKSFRGSGLHSVPSRWKGKCEIGTKCNKKLIGARAFFKGYFK